MENSQEKKYVLDCEYKDPERPYSQQELVDLIENLKKKLKLSEEKLEYTDRNYTYYAKKYGKKESTVLENKKNNIDDYNINVSGCSVKWQLQQTPYEFKGIAKDIINSYMDFEYNPPSKLTYFNVEVFRMFYSWLYL